MNWPKPCAWVWSPTATALSPEALVFEPKAAELRPPLWTELPTANESAAATLLTPMVSCTGFTGKKLPLAADVSTRCPPMKMPGGLVGSSTIAGAADTVLSNNVRRFAASNFMTGSGVAAVDVEPRSQIESFAERVTPKRTIEFGPASEADR